MSAGWLLLNAAYVVYTASAALKDMLRLRVTLLVASILYMAYGAVDPNYSVLLWNLPVTALHAVGIARLLRARRGQDVGEEAEAIRTLFFPSLDPPSFATFWRSGSERVIDDEVLIVQGAEVAELSLILDGTVVVNVTPAAAGTFTPLSITLGRYRFLGEISTLTGQTASATVTAQGEVRLLSWDKQVLRDFESTHPQIHAALLQALGQEVARKLR